jgi:hypothetical protein
MPGKWFYTHNGRTEGPLSAAEIKELVARRKIQEEDRFWPEGTDPREAIPLSKALDFFGLYAGAAGDSGPTPCTGSLPDWLRDIQALERKGPVPGPGPTSEIPNWLEDLRLWVALGLSPPVPRPLAEAPEGSPAGIPLPAPDGGLPEWLEGWTLEEQRKGSRPRGGINTLIEGWQPEAELTPPPAPLDEKDIPLAIEVPEAVPVPSPRPEEALIDLTIQETGFDPRSGKIIDPDQFRNWKEAERPTNAPTGLTNASLIEVFRKARTAIENWVDDDHNRLRIEHADWDEIQQAPSLQALFAKYAPYGQELLDRLTRHLAFLVENRRKFYRAARKSR